MFKKMIVGAFCFTMIACGGGGTDSIFDDICFGCGNGDGSGGLNHNQLAEAFVASLNASGNITVTLVKKSTLRENFIVIYNNTTQQHIAVTLDGYVANTDAYAYFEANQARFFTGLEVLPSYTEIRIGQRTETRPESFYEFNAECNCHTWVTRDVEYTVDYEYEHTVPVRYRDIPSQLTFEKIDATPKDLEKMAALKEAAEMSAVSEKLQTSFGLSQERSMEVARLTAAWNKAGGKNLTVNEHDSFSKDVLGFTITEGKNAIQSGNVTSINSLIEKAAITNGTSQENVREIIKSFMN